MRSDGSEGLQFAGYLLRGGRVVLRAAADLDHGGLEFAAVQVEWEPHEGCAAIGMFVDVGDPGQECLTLVQACLDAGVL